MFHFTTSALLPCTVLLLTLLTPSHSHNSHTLTDDSEGSGIVNKRNCSNSFSVLEETLLSNEKNRFNLIKTLYPPRGALPVFLTVTYWFDEYDNQFDEYVNRSDEYGNETVWYWSESEVYLIQPLDILRFTSLFHSNFDYRSGELDLVLNRDCAGTRVDFMEMLTQRLKLYAQTQRVSTTAEPLRISDVYLAVAASREDIVSESLQSNFVRVWLHLVFIIFPVATVIVVYTCDPIQLLLGDKTWQKLRDETNHPRLAAMIQISVVFTVYVFIIDCFSFAYTVTSDLYSDHTHSGFYLTTVTGFLVDLAALLWVTFVLLTSCNCRSLLRGQLCEKVTSTRIHTLLVTTTVSPLLCSANHLPYVVLSYISDPYHAGSVTMGYFFSFLLFYFIFGQVYSRVVLRTGSRPKDFPFAVNADLVHYPDGDACRRKVRVPFNMQVVLLSLVIVTPLLVFYEGILIVLFWSLPIRKVLEDSPTHLYTIYQGTGILIVALLTYSIILRPSPFSFAGAFDKLGKQLQIPQKLGRKWVRMGDEEKAAVVIRTLYSSIRVGGAGSESEGIRQEVLSGVAEDVMSSVTMSPRSPSVTSPKKGGAYRCGNEDVRLEAMNSLDEENVSKDVENSISDTHKDSDL